MLSGGSVTFGGSVCFGGTVGDSVSAGFAVSGLPLSARAVLLFFSFSAVDSAVLSVPAGRLLSAVGSEALSVSVAVILLSVLTAPLSVLSFALSAAHHARLSVISPARRAASIFSILIDITSIYRIPIIREKSSTFYKLRKQVTLTARKQVLRLRQVLRIQFAVRPAPVPFSAHRHQEHIR